MRKWNAAKQQKEIQARIASPNNIDIARSMAQVLVWYGEKYPDKNLPYLERAKKALLELSKGGSLSTPSQIYKCILHRKKEHNEVGFTLELGRGWAISKSYITVRLNGMPEVVTTFETLTN